MPLHLIKLCVGCDSVAGLSARQAQRLDDLRRAHSVPELVHVTRQTPRQAQDLLDGGSLYWVIKGWIAARQKLVELRPVMKDGVPHCGLVYDTELITVRPLQRRPFQGWRYLKAEDAPPDLAPGDQTAEMPEAMRRELAELGLL